jgi:hypothetical protein
MAVAEITAAAADSKIANNILNGAAQKPRHFAFITLLFESGRILLKIPEQ